MYHDTNGRVAADDRCSAPQRFRLWLKPVLGCGDHDDISFYRSDGLSPPVSSHIHYLKHTTHHDSKTWAVIFDEVGTYKLITRARFGNKTTISSISASYASGTTERRINGWDSDAQY